MMRPAPPRRLLPILRRLQSLLHGPIPGRIELEYVGLILLLHVRQMQSIGVRLFS